MKNKIFALLLVFSLILCSWVSVFAEENISVVVDGQNITFDVAPRLIGGRTMVPLRAIFEALGAEVTWDDATQTVMAYNEAYIVKCTIGSNTIYVNNVAKEIDVAPMEINSRTLVPVRFIAEAFGCDVQWNASTMTVTVTSSPVDYTKIEQGENSSFYPRTTIPTYTSIAGTPLRSSNEKDNVIFYTYPYDYDKQLEYIDALKSCGWSFVDYDESKNESITCYLEKGTEFIGISYVVFLDELWIITANN